METKGRPDRPGAPAADAIQLSIPGYACPTPRDAKVEGNPQLSLSPDRWAMDQETMLRVVRIGNGNGVVYRNCQKRPKWKDPRQNFSRR